MSLPVVCLLLRVCLSSTLRHVSVCFWPCRPHREPAKLAVVFVFGLLLQRNRPELRGSNLGSPLILRSVHCCFFFILTPRTSQETLLYHLACVRYFTTFINTVAKQFKVTRRWCFVRRSGAVAEGFSLAPPSLTGRSSVATGTEIRYSYSHACSCCVHACSHPNTLTSIIFCNLT